MTRSSGFSVVLVLGLVLGCKGVLKDEYRDRTNPIIVAIDAGDAASLTDASQACIGGECGAEGEDAAGGSGEIICGNGQRQTGEQCDDGNVLAGDGCDEQCAAELMPPGPACGDGLLDLVLEECDDANPDSGDGCDGRCRTERCGNERRDEGEDCDPPVTGVCDQSCRTVLPNCGDGTLQKDEGEACDDGNAARGDGCNACREECGDDLLERDIGEECEPKYAAEGTCDEDTCKRLPLCGDGKVDDEAGEQCDPSDGVGCVNCLISHDAGSPDGGAEVFQCVAPMPQVAIVNGAFDSDLTGWLPASGAVSSSLAPSGASSGPGSVEVVYTPVAGPTASVDGVVQCIPVQAGVTYTLALQYYNPTANVAGVLPGISIKLYDNLTCAGGFSSGSGPSVNRARDTWLPFVRSINTSALGSDGHLGSMEVELGVFVPSGETSGTLRFDDIVLSGCGNCVVEESAGESCDDGNLIAADGCSPACTLECGNGQIESPEQCDDSNFAFSDSCTPSCRIMTSCDNCAQASCQAPVDACLALTGVAEAGPRRGMPRSALCAQLRDCIHETGCNLNTAIANRVTLGGVPADPLNPDLPENCYCGSSGLDCLQGNAANGSCRAEVEAALETVNPYQILQRVGGSDADFPVFAGVLDLLVCENQLCSAQCSKEITCGNGFLEDRSQAFTSQFTFLIDRLPQPCLDEYTHTQLGCSFEECDDGNTEDGDGCDEHCFEEACGNYLKQGLEDCDDGNSVDGDGCSSNCGAEYVCGDTEVTEPFEECEPPSTGSMCSLDEYEDDDIRATACGCDDACVYKVCGNSVVQEGEECDPPNGGSCDDTCQRAVDECTECILRIGDGQYCPADLLLNGSGIPGDGFEVGCLADAECLPLWTCESESLCGVSPQSYAYCYCSSTPADFAACESNSNFVVHGACTTEILDAFEAQWGRAPNSHSEVLASYLDEPPGAGRRPVAIANYLTLFCLIPDGQSHSLRSQLLASGVNEVESEACVSACFP